MTQQNIIILGSTGSIGMQVLDVIRLHPQDFNIVGLTAHKNHTLLDKQINEFKPKYGGETEIEKIEQMVLQKDVDIVFVGCSGTDLFDAVTKAVKTGKKIAMANKEMIVEQGDVLMEEVRRNNAQLIPVDSEHSGIFQCLIGREVKDIEKVILTCSGGPFWKNSRSELADVTMEEALNHPIWDMGKKTTIDSATLMNKALEIIEAHYLFDIDPKKIEVLIHPQGIVHALVQFKDGSTIAHMGYPDMRLPISFALYYPLIKENKLPRFDLTDKNLEFFKPDSEIFPSLNFAYDALSRKGELPRKLNRANEKAVEQFLNNEISFLEIFEKIGAIIRRN